MSLKTTHTDKSITTTPLSARELRAQRLDQLLESCQDQVIAQIIGPFGLSRAMLNDKDGGNVATVLNADKGIFPDQKHQENYALANQEYQKKNSDDAGARGNKHRQINKTFDAGGNVQSEITNRPMTKGEVNGDHVQSLKEAHDDKSLHLRFTQEERKQLLNDPSNMAFIEESLNKSKGAKSWEECLNNPEFVKKHNLTPEMISKIQIKDKEARRNITWAKDKQLGKELLSTGVEQAARNAMSQAFGVLLHEVVNSSFIEIKLILKDKSDQRNLIDRLIESFKRVLDNTVSKLRTALDAALAGGVQGFLSNLLTFIINNLVTTAKKFVAAIRQGVEGFWQAIKLLWNPPANMTSLDIARQVSKIIAGVVATTLGLMMEETIKGVITTTFPFLIPIADAVATGLTAILSGIAGALIVYGIDRIFDWLDSKGTALLEAYESTLNQQKDILGKMGHWLDSLFENSTLYAVCIAEYDKSIDNYRLAIYHFENSVMEAQNAVIRQTDNLKRIQNQIERKHQFVAALKNI